MDAPPPGPEGPGLRCSRYPVIMQLALGLALEDKGTTAAPQGREGNTAPLSDNAVPREHCVQCGLFDGLWPRKAP